MTERGEVPRVQVGSRRFDARILRHPPQFARETPWHRGCFFHRTMTPAAQGTILIADDSEEMRDLVRTWLARRNRDVTIITAKSGHEVLAMIETLFSAGPEQAGPVLVITDYRMPGVDGLSLLDALAHSPYDVPCIVMTGFGDAAMHARFAEHGARASFDKPLDLDRLADVAAEVLRSHGHPTVAEARRAEHE